MTLKEYKDRNKLSYKQIADLINLPSMTVYRYVNSQRIPHPKLMKKITDKIGITPNEIYDEYYNKHNFK